MNLNDHQLQVPIKLYAVSADEIASLRALHKAADAFSAILDSQGNTDSAKELEGHCALIRTMVKRLIQSKDTEITVRMKVSQS